jgi:hypothetical protein
MLDLPLAGVDILARDSVFPANLLPVPAAAPALQVPGNRVRCTRDAGCRVRR